MATLTTPAWLLAAPSSPTPPAGRREPRLGEGDLALGPHRADRGHDVVPVDVQAGNRVQHLLHIPPPSRSSNQQPAPASAVGEGTTVEAESGVRARSDTQRSPRPRARLSTRTRLQKTVGDHTPRPSPGFHVSVVTLGHVDFQ